MNCWEERGSHNKAVYEDLPREATLIMRTVITARQSQNDEQQILWHAHTLLSFTPPHVCVFFRMKFVLITSFLYIKRVLVVMLN